MITLPLSELWLDLWSDLQDPRWLWQIAVLAICMGAGWSFAHALKKRFALQNRISSGVIGVGVESFARVLSPLLTLTLVLIAKPFLAKWYHVNLLRVAIPLLVSLVLIRLAFYVLRRIFLNRGTANSCLASFEKVFATLVWIGVAIYLTGLWPDLLEALDAIEISVGRNKLSLLTIFQATVSVVVTLLLALWGGAILEEHLMQLDNVHSSIRAVMARMGRAVLILIAMLVSLSLVGIDLTVLSVFGGALGVGIGLGMQKIVSSYVSGFVILLERSLSVGDMVAVDKYSGKVTQINTRYTILQSLDGIETVVPNDMLVSGPIQNYSLSNKTLRLATQVSVSYQTDLDTVLRLLEQAAATIARVAKDPAPQATLMKLGSHGFELELGFWIDDPENGRQGVLSDVNIAIWTTLQIHQITVPYPQYEVRVLGTPNKCSSITHLNLGDA